MVQRGNFSHCLVNCHGTYEKGLVIINITMACDISIQCVCVRECFVYFMGVSNTLFSLYKIVGLKTWRAPSFLAVHPAFFTWVHACTQFFSLISSPVRTSIQGGIFFSKLSINFYRTYKRGVVDIDITMACDISIQCVFFSTKTMGIMKIHFGHPVGKYDPQY